jgi:hypothetical protein
VLPVPFQWLKRFELHLWILRSTHSRLRATTNTLEPCGSFDKSFDLSSIKEQGWLSS